MFPDPLSGYGVRGTQPVVKREASLVRDYHVLSAVLRDLVYLKNPLNKDFIEHRGKPTYVVLHSEAMNTMQSIILTHQYLNVALIKDSTKYIERDVLDSLRTRNAGKQTAFSKEGLRRERDRCSERGSGGGRRPSRIIRDKVLADASSRLGIFELIGPATRKVNVTVWWYCSGVHLLMA